MRVVAGKIPHGDFHANYGPLHFYLLALALPNLWRDAFSRDESSYTIICGTIVALMYAIASCYSSTMVVSGGQL